MVMHLLLDEFKLKDGQQQNDGKQDKCLRAADPETEIDEGILIDVEYHDVGAVHRTALGEDVDLTECLKAPITETTDVKNNVGEISGIVIRKNVLSGPEPSILVLS